VNDRRLLIDQIGTRTPCNADWDSMIGNDQVRFCEHCAKSVHDLSSMTRARAENLVIESNGALCITYRLRSDGRPEIANRAQPIYNLTRKISKLAASAFAVALTVSNSVMAKQSVVNLPLTSSRLGNWDPLANEQDQEKRIFAGRVIDSNKSPLSGATVTLKGLKSGGEFTTTSDKLGLFCIDGLGVERYDATMRAANFKSVVIKGIDISITPVTKMEFEAVAGDPNEEIVKPPTYRYGAMGGIWIYDDDVNRQAFEDFESGKLSAGKLDRRTMAVALDWAIQYNKIDEVRALLAAGAKVNFTTKPNANNQQSKPRHSTALFSMTSETGTEIIDDLLNAGADFNLKGSSDESFIGFASAVGNTTVIKYLLRLGLDVNEADKDGWTPLMHSASRDDLESVKALLDAGANPDLRNKDGFTALSVALNSLYMRSAKTRDIIRLLRPLTSAD